MAGELRPHDFLRFGIGDPAVGQFDVLVVMTTGTDDRRGAMALVAIGALKRQVLVMALVRIEGARFRRSLELVVAQRAVIAEQIDMAVLICAEVVCGLVPPSRQMLAHAFVERIEIVAGSPADTLADLLAYYCMMATHAADLGHGRRLGVTVHSRHHGIRV